MRLSDCLGSAMKHNRAGCQGARPAVDADGRSAGPPGSPVEVGPRGPASCVPRREMARLEGFEPPTWLRKPLSKVYLEEFKKEMRCIMMS